MDMVMVMGKGRGELGGRGGGFNVKRGLFRYGSWIDFSKRRRKGGFNGFV